MGTHCRLYSGGSWLLDMNVLTSSEGLAHAAWPAACRGAVHDPKTPRQGSLSIVCHRWRPSVPSVGQHPAPPSRQSQVKFATCCVVFMRPGADDDDPDSTFGHFSHLHRVLPPQRIQLESTDYLLPQPAALLVHRGARPDDRRTQMLPRHRDGQHRGPT